MNQLFYRGREGFHKFCLKIPITSIDTDPDHAQFIIVEAEGRTKEDAFLHLCFRAGEVGARLQDVNLVRVPQIESAIEVDILGRPINSGSVSDRLWAKSLFTDGRNFSITITEDIDDTLFDYGNRLHPIYDDGTISSDTTPGDEAKKKE